MKKEEMCVNCVFCEMNNGVEYCAVTGGMVETDGYCLSFKKEKDENKKEERMNFMMSPYAS